MVRDDRISAVSYLLQEYVRSPSLRHLRDPYSIEKLARDIIKRIERGNVIWTKWTDHREHVLKSAIACWVPTDDLLTFLNAMPGPQLTRTDVEQRLRAFEEERHTYADEELKGGCLALYEKEKADGTALPAIIGALREYIENEEARMYQEREQHRQERLGREREEREQRLYSGADCKWTQLRKSPHLFCRMNGRTYRLSPSPDKRWNLYRVNTVSAEEKGTLLGTYQGRGDATKAVAVVAYQAEPRR